MKVSPVVLWIVGGLAGVVVVWGVVGTAGLKSGRKLPIARVDFSKLKDGTYTGSYTGGRWSNEVRVTVASGRVTDITVLKNVAARIPQLTDKLVASVIKTQSLQVDTVSGATVTTKAYLKAMEDALAEAK